jgi:hypothetical protein
MRCAFVYHDQIMSLLLVDELWIGLAEIPLHRENASIFAYLSPFIGQPKYSKGSSVMIHFINMLLRASV